MPHRHGAEKIAQAGWWFADDRARVRIDEKGLVALERHRGGRGGVRAQGEASWCQPRLGCGRFRQQRLWREVPGANRGRRRPGAAVRPLEHLLLVGEGHARDRHDEDHNPGNNAADQVHPENDRTKESHGFKLRLSLKLGTSILPTKMVVQGHNEN